MLKSKVYHIVFYLLLSALINTIDLILVSQQTCLQYQVSEAPSSKIFYFHYNHNTDSVKLTLYKKNSRMILQDSGNGIHYDNTIRADYQQTGNYTFCFQKKSQSFADISFEILENDKQMEFVGKQQITKLSKRISQSLVSIKQIGFNFKNIIDMHNKRKQSMAQRDNYYAILLIIKIVVMLAIVLMQILAVKMIFK